MLTSFRMQGFRKYKELSIENMGRVNFILGSNNIGKTSILEGIYTWACGQNISPLINIPLARCRYSGIQNPYWMMEEVMAVINQREQIPFQMSFSGTFNGRKVQFNHSVYPSDLLTEYDASYKKVADSTIPKTNVHTAQDPPIIIPSSIGMVQFNQQPTVVARWEVEQNGEVVTDNITIPVAIVSKVKPFQLAKYIDVLSHTSVSETVQMYSSLKREKMLEDVSNEIRKVFPEIVGFDMLPYPDGSQAPISILKDDGSLLPMYAYGDGIQRWFYILGAIALYKNSIICIDEIDTGFHPSAQVKFCKHLSKYAKANNVQLFVTTHNIEFIDHYLNSLNELGNEYVTDARVITLRNVDNGTKTRTLSAYDAEKLREEYRMELR